MRLGPAFGLTLLTAIGAACVSPMSFHAIDTGEGGTGAQGGTGGSGGAPSFCAPGETRECYTGPDGTKGQGICKAGVETCNADGSAFGACEGEQLPMVDDCATPEDDDCDGQSPDCVGLHLWSKRFGDSFAQLSECVATAGSGDVAIGGLFYGSIDFGGGGMTAAVGGIGQNADMFVAKFDPAGNHLFSKRLGDEHGEAALAIAMDESGDLLIMGSFAGELDLDGALLTAAQEGSPEIFVAKLDGTTGTHLWSKSLEGSPGLPAGYAIDVDPAGRVIVAGSFAGTIDFGEGAVTAAGPADVFVASLDATTGAPLWVETFGDGSGQAATAVATTEDGAVVLAGTFSGSLDFGAEPLVSAGEHDIFVAKLDAAGAPIWSRAFGDSGEDEGRSVAVDALTNVIVSGKKEGAGPDIFVAKLDAGGGEVWTRVFGDGKAQEGRAVAVDPGGNVLVAGAFSGSVDFGDGGKITNFGGADMFLAKLSPDGSHLWSRRFGDDGGDDQVAAALATDDKGNVFVTGQFWGSMDVGPSTLMSAGLYDVILMKLTP